MAAFLALLLLLLSSPSVLSADDFTPRCGDCWCVPANGSCPSFEPGIYQSFPSRWISLYRSFQLTSDVVNLDGEDGSINSCYPFSGAVDLSLVIYPEARLSPCVVPSAQATAVCAYVRSENSTSCSGSSYELQTFGTIEELRSAAGASLVHSGECGVCSNAGDLAVRMNTTSTLQSQSISCGFNYFADSDFNNLISCYSKIGFSTPCATLYAHNTATNFYLCGKQGLCFPDQATNELPMNDLTQPGCPFTACYNCSVPFGTAFDLLSGLGRNAYNAGFNDAVALPCSYFTRVSHNDTCFALTPTVSPAPNAVATPQPQAASPSPPTSPTSSSRQLWVHSCVASWTSTTLLLLSLKS
jgi:hypothetical protein